MNQLFIFLLCLWVFPWHAQSQTGADPFPVSVLPGERLAAASVARSLDKKTLSELGSITVVRIDSTFLPSEDKGTPAAELAEREIAKTQPPQHRFVWKIIETYELNIGPPGTGFAPRFYLEYSNGIKVFANRYNAKVVFPNGTIECYSLGTFTIRNESEKTGADNPHNR